METGGKQRKFPRSFLLFWEFASLIHPSIFLQSSTTSYGFHTKPRCIISFLATYFLELPSQNPHHKRPLFQILFLRLSQRHETFSTTYDFKKAVREKSVADYKDSPAHDKLHSTHRGCFKLDPSSVPGSRTRRASSNKEQEGRL